MLEAMWSTLSGNLILQAPTYKLLLYFFLRHDIVVFRDFDVGHRFGRGHRDNINRYHHVIHGKDQSIRLCH